MAKHIADQPRARTEGARVREYTRIEREQNPRAVTRDLQRRSSDRADSRRMQEFLLRERLQRV